MRKRIYQIIELSSGEDIASRVYDTIMCISIMACLIPMMFRRTHIVFSYLDWAVTFVFLVDYILRLLTADFKLPKLKKCFHKPVIANISGFSVDEYKYCCERIDKQDAVGIIEVNVSCPNVSGQYTENWGLDDPSGKSDEVFIETIRVIEEKIHQLKEKLQ